MGGGSHCTVRRGARGWLQVLSSGHPHPLTLPLVLPHQEGEDSVQIARGYIPALTFG